MVVRVGGCPVHSSVAEHWRLKPGVLHGFDSWQLLAFSLSSIFSSKTPNLFLHVFFLCYSAAI